MNMNFDLNADFGDDVGDSVEEMDTELETPVTGESQTSVSGDSTDNCAGSNFNESTSRMQTSNTCHQSLQATEIASRLTEGSELEGLDQAYVLYCEYARLMGFSVKKGSQGYFPKSDDLRMKLYFCSCEGRSENRASRMKLPVYKKQNTRTGCRARLRIVREFDGPWRVSVFVEEHNHELVGPDDSYTLRSSRNLSHAKKSILETFNDAGIGVNLACRFMEKEAGGPQHMGFIRKDAYDHIGKIRKVSKLDNNDADALLQYFQAKHAAEPDFFWRVLLDDEGRLMNFYFRDCRCAADYEAFGDVVSVDTTFKTNKYNLLCAPFVGVNHHRQNILFGIAFLSDETSESFEWLFSTFLESMNGKEPQIIFSDQDVALMNGIDHNFRSAKHRLCQWHVNQNAPSHFGKLNGNKEFKEAWFHCMNGCEDESEFERCWKSMTTTYDLKQNKWFSSMYRLRPRWADVFTNTKFTAGLHATSRSESTNKVIKGLCAASCSLHDFVTHYETIITDWRRKERVEDAMNRGLPGQFIEGNRFLMQAARIYTRNVYKLFEIEVANSINVYAKQVSHDVEGGDMLFNVTSEGRNTTRRVAFNQITSTLSCSCRKLETDGLFCRHIISVFHNLNLTTLPERYFLKRWSKEAKHRDRESLSSQLSKRDSVPDMVFVSSVMRRTYDIAMDYKEIIEDRQIIVDHLDALLAALSKKEDGGNKKKKTVGTRSKASSKSRFQNPRTPTHKWLPPKKASRKGKKNAQEQDKSAALKDHTSMDTNTVTASYARHCDNNGDARSHDASEHFYSSTPNTLPFGYEQNTRCAEDFMTQLSMA